MPPPEAIEHYQRGRAHYKAGRYREAVQELEQALAHDPESPELVYNLARVYELLGSIDPAIANYRRYVSMLAESEQAERERAHDAIRRLEGARAQRVRERPPVARPVVVRTERGVADRAFWTLASLSIAALAVGGVTGALALRAEHRAHAFVLGVDGDQQALARQARQANRLAASSDVTCALGAVGGLTSALLYALRTRAVVQPSVAVVRDGLTLTLRGSL